jgi:ubiquitin-protein ligase
MTQQKTIAIKRLKVEFIHSDYDEYNIDCCQNENWNVNEHFDTSEVINHLNNDNNRCVHQLNFYRRTPTNKKYKKANVQISCSQSYPFKMPEVLLNNKSYCLFFSSNLIVKQEYIELILGKNKCICCLHSILRPDVWSPTNTIKDILYEVDKKIKIKIDAIKLYYMDKIAIKYFPEEFIDFKQYLTHI